MQKVCIQLNNEKQIFIDVYEEYAPLTATHFLHLVDTGFYNNTFFHRIISGFMCQCGGYFNENGVLIERKPGYTIPGEFTENGWKNPINHTAGVVSMARTSDFNSASGQFFICDADSLFLDSQYAAFGITGDEDSLNIIHELCQTPTGTLSGMFEDFPAVPIEEVMIRTIFRVKES